MRAVPCRGIWRRIPVFVLIAGIVAVFTVSGCGGDDPQNPNGNGGNGGGEVTVLSASTSAGWTLDMFVQQRVGTNCDVTSHQTSDINEVWVAGGFSVQTQSRTGDNCCQSEIKNSTITSNRFDLTGFTAVRLKGQLRMYCERYVEPGGQRGRIRLYVNSNTPSTPGVEAFDEIFYAEVTGETFVERNIDVSLENALTFDEASVELMIDVNGGCSGLKPNLRWNQVYIELLDLRIVATK